jgi:5-methylcytosine-specific restriction endonuclease McrA
MMGRRQTGPDTQVRLFVLARSGHLCERCKASRDFLQLHHRLPRRAGGTRNPLSNDPSNLAVLCWRCHRDVESNRSAAYQAGWLLHAGDDPRTVTPIPLEAS